MSSPSSSPSPSASSVDEEDQEPDSLDRPTAIQPLPPQYPISEASSSRPPPPFSSLYDDPPATQPEAHNPGPPYSPAGASVAHSAPSYNTLPVSPFAPPDLRQLSGTSEGPDLAPKQEPPEPNKTSSKEDDLEPPPAYSEGPSPLYSFSYVMATAGGASSILTQVQQGGPPTSTLGGEHPTSCQLLTVTY